MSESPNLHTVLSQLGLTFRKIKFGGVVGKQTLLGLIGAGALAVIAWRADPRYAWILGICAAILLLTVAVLNFVYADKHPGEATLEGAEIIAFHHQAFWAKNMTGLPSDSRILPNPDGAPPQLNPPEGVDT